MQVTVHDAIDNLARDQWNALVGKRFPFLCHEFLSAAESSGSVSPATGWSPRHLSISDSKGMRAAMPLYEKSHSWGEFVFDWAWANAYEQAGLRYYPKLVSAVPFTPAPSARLLLRQADDEEAAQLLLEAAITLAEETDCSSFHVLFSIESEIGLLKETGMTIRKDCQFHWHNNNYTSFDDFLASFTSSKRKKARRDRRRVEENGIRFRRLRGNEVGAEMLSTIYELISNTFLRRGSTPYFSEEFFRDINTTLSENILYVVAEKDASPVAAAVFFESEDRLYGRYWGSDGHHDALHFETCYYQGIDYCIETGKLVFEPGTQGEHKISRGFTPTPTYSGHWLAHPQFAHAIERYLDEEGKHVERYMDAVDSHTPYKRVDESQ